MRAAGHDPSRIEGRAKALAKAQKRKRDEEGEEEEGDIDEDLAAELDLALGDDDGENDGDEEDEDEDESDDEDEDDDDDEAVQAKKLLNEEIRDLEAAVAKKNHEIASSANPLIRVRYFTPTRRCMRLIEVHSAASRTLFASCKPTWTPNLPSATR